MQLIGEVAALAKALDAERARGREVGLVPTMGCLHAGHLSLVSRARAECGAVAVSVFVNPTQFDSPDDLARYPRALEADLEAAAGAGADYVFAPPESEMYPSPPRVRVEVTGPAAELWEGAWRPGHLGGVATVVTKLLAAAGRCRAYFGEKDYQQLVVVRRLVDELCLPAQVVGCPTVREPDGLACSSRNLRLGPEERAAAPVLWRALCRGREALLAGERRPGAVERAMADEVASCPLARLEYAAVVDAATLERPPVAAGELRLLVAARLGAERLIDNLGVSLG